MNLTYAELAEAISHMTVEQKQSNVTVYVPGIDEFYPIGAVSFATETQDVLDKSHPFFLISNI